MNTVLSDPKRLRTPGGHGYLVSWKHRLKVQGDERAAATVERILDDPANVESLRAGIGRPEASLDELAEWLTTGLSSGALQLLKTRVNPPVMDRPPETNLFDLLPPPEPEPRRELESLSFEVVDGDGQGVAVRYQVHAPSGDPAGSLPPGERGSVGELESDADVEVEFSGIQLPLREEGGEDEKEDEPRPLGPGGTDPDRQDAPGDQVPLGPGGVEPNTERFPLHRTAPTPFEVSGALALPRVGHEHRHFIPVVLRALEAARRHQASAVWVVALGRPGVAASQLSSVEAVFRGNREAWVALATEDGSLDEVSGYFAHLSVHRGWVIPGGGTSKAQVEAFQAESNSRFGGSILEDGVCGSQTLGAVFDALRDELRRWLPAFALAESDLQAESLRFVEGDPQGIRRPAGSGLDAWVFDESKLPTTATLELLYADPRADVDPIHVPFSFESDELVVRLRAGSAAELDGYVGVRLERCDASWKAELPIVPGEPAQDVAFAEVATDGRYTVSLVREDGTREILLADRPFGAFLDDREAQG